MVNCTEYIIFLGTCTFEINPHLYPLSDLWCFFSSKCSLWSYNRQRKKIKHFEERAKGNLLSRKLHLNIGVDKVSVLSNEGLFHIRHDAGVHFRKPLSTMDLHIKSCPLSLCWDAFWEEQISEAQGMQQNIFRDQTTESYCIYCYVFSQKYESDKCKAFVDRWSLIRQILFELRGQSFDYIHSKKPLP